MSAPHPAQSLRARESHVLSGVRIAVAVDGGFDAPQAVRVVRALVRHDADVIVAATPAALRLVDASALEYASGLPPSVWPDPSMGRVEGVVTVGIDRKTRRKSASGVADTLVSLLLASGAPEFPFATDPEELLDRLLPAFARGPLRNRKILVVAGASREPWDAMREVTTSASARTGRALARELGRRGARVTLSAFAERDRVGPAPRLRFRTRAELVRAVAGGSFDLAVLEANQPSVSPQRARGKVASSTEDLALATRPLSPIDQGLERTAKRLILFRTRCSGGLVQGSIEGNASPVQAQGSAQEVAALLASAVEAVV